MDEETCTQVARTRLEKVEPDADRDVRQAVAEEMCRLLNSRKLENDIDENTYAGPFDVEYLLSRLEVRGDDADLPTKWNYWVGQMCYFAGDDYEQYKIDSE